MKVTLCRFCDYYFQTADQKNCIVGMFDSIGAKQFPFTQETFHLCFELEFEKNESGKSCDLTVRMVNEAGKELFGVTAKFDIPPINMGARTRVFQDFKIQNLEFPAPGTHKLEFKINDKTILEDQLFVADMR